MRVLKQGMQGVDVIRWQNFLIGQSLYEGEADGKFGPKTTKATANFQENEEVRVTGVVDDTTYGAAILRGFSIAEDDTNGEETKNWPLPPDFLPPLNTTSKQVLFGTFTFAPAPTPGNPEGIRILGDWNKENIEQVYLPQLKGVQGAPQNGIVLFHKKGAQQLRDLWQAWENAGLLELVRSWAGAWAPRFIRGSRTVLSNHAFGTAFDINAAWNGLGTVPPLVGHPGSLRKLVPLANEHGFYWGGHFNNRPDGMHFELGKLL